MDESTILGILAGASIVLIVFIVAFLVVYCVALYKMFKKAGKHGWEAFIPYYNSWVLVEISGLGWWWFLILIISAFISNSEESISIIGSIGNCLAYFCIFYNISKKLHKDIWMPVLSIFLPFINVFLIGFSKNFVFDNNVRVTENGPFDANKIKDDFGTNNTSSQSNGSIDFNNTDSTNNEKVNYCPNCGNKVTGNVFCSNCGSKIK